MEGKRGIERGKREVGGRKREKEESKDEGDWRERRKKSNGES